MIGMTGRIEGYRVRLAVSRVEYDAIDDGRFCYYEVELGLIFTVFGVLAAPEAMWDLLRHEANGR